MRIELHCHSLRSDGALAPAEVATRAVARGVQLFALTDHDTCAGTADAHVATAQNVRAVEISCDENGATVHLLAFDTGGDWAALEDRLAAVRAARVSRLRKMAARLTQRGITVDIEALVERSDGRAVGRPDLARALVAQGVVRTMKEAFSRHLYDGGPVDVPHEGLSVQDAVASATAAGARVSLAHPHLYAERTIPLLRKHRDAGLGGIEAHYGHYDAGERARWREVARKHDLIETGGSDFHAPGDPELGVDVPDEVATALGAWLRLP